MTRRNGVSEPPRSATPGGSLGCSTLRVHPTPGIAAERATIARLRRARSAYRLQRLPAQKPPQTAKRGFCDPRDYPPGVKPRTGPRLGCTREGWNRYAERCAPVGRAIVARGDSSLTNARSVTGAIRRRRLVRRPERVSPVGEPPHPARLPSLRRGSRVERGFRRTAKARVRPCAHSRPVRVAQPQESPEPPQQPRLLRTPPRSPSASLA